MAKSLPFIGDDDEKLDTLIKSLKTQLDADTYDRVVKVFQLSQSRIAESELLKTKGSDQGADVTSDAVSKVEELAKAEQDKDGSLSEPQAIAKVLSNPENRALYGEYHEQLRKLRA